jgi:hypothetical protein
MNAQNTIKAAKSLKVKTNVKAGGQQLPAQVIPTGPSTGVMGK